MMGYDMYLAEPIAPKAPVVEDAPDENYFRLNIWGMSRFGGVMAALGMIDENARMRVDFPQVDDPAVLERCLAQRETTPAGLPAYKLSSNDGWLVLPEEIRPALDLYRALTEPEKRVAAAGVELDYWREWIAFLDRAAAHGGFRVW
jgi:hypothetical protein